MGLQMWPRIWMRDVYWNWDEACIRYRDKGGLYLAWVNPYGIHVESMESISNSMWIPWNECWLRPQPIYGSMDIMDSMWNDHGMVMEWSIPYGIHCYSTWIPCGMIMEWSWNGQFHMASIAIPPGFHWIPWTSPYGFHGLVHMDSMEQVHMELMTITFTVSLLF